MAEDIGEKRLYQFWKDPWWDEQQTSRAKGEWRMLPAPSSSKSERVSQGIQDEGRGRIEGKGIG